ncbi:glycosyltransferase [Caldifermentibacillus hisashii]|uniref:glycosyltransferase n=1 Tax=Caldifermentibacillus hisashii TaxID=996558 RepID=UPI002E08266A|nr:glycosyltransferase [Caldifermentibacillus hisashii]MEC5271998.1 glycosyltransferase [Caldifermentibacillus hisashii]
MKKIIYIVSVFPSTSATFVLNEMLRLKERGYQVTILSLRHPVNEVIQTGTENFKSIYYLPHIKQRKKDIFKLLSKNMQFFISHPVMYIKNLFNACKFKSSKMLYDFFRAVYIVPMINSLNIKHVHAQFAHGPTNIAYFIKQLTNQKYSFTCHAVDLFVQNTPRILEEKIKNSEFVATISSFNVNFIEERLLDKNLIEKVNVVRCGIDLEKITPNNNNSNARNVVKILSIGRFVEKKGFVYLVDALYKLKVRGLSFNCQLIGDGTLFNEIKKKIKELKLTNDIELLGKLDSKKIGEYLSDSDIFVLPCITAKDGDMDGIPVSIMEAMAYKVPVISTRISGIPELIINGESGLLVEEKDSEMLAEALEKLILNKRLRLILGKSGRRKIEEEYNLDQNVNKLIELFERVV